MNPERMSPSHLEGREMKSPVVEIQDISAFKNENIDDILNRSIERILAIVKKKKVKELFFRDDFNIPKDVPFEEGLRKAAEEKKRQYLESLPKKTEAFGGQAEHCFNLAKEKGYLIQARDYGIVVSDDFLHHGLLPERKEERETQFDDEDLPLHAYIHDHEKIFVGIDDSNKVLAHEVGHALSSNKERGWTGFSQLKQDKQGKWRSHGNRWFTEAVTVMWEDISVNDGSKSASDKGDKNRDLALLLINEAGLDQDTVFKGYFGNEEMRNLVFDKIKERFNCSIDDLKMLNYKDINFAKLVVKGQEVELSLDDKMRDWEIDLVKKLTEIFLNIKVVDNREKT